MGYDEVFIPFAVAAITPLGCAWVASRFVPPTNKWIYGGVVIGTAYFSWKYIVPRMLTSMGYPVPFEAETEYCEECSYREHDACPMIEGCPCCDETIDALEYQAESADKFGIKWGPEDMPCPKCGETTLELTEDLGRGGYREFKGRYFYTCTDKIGCDSGSWEGSEVLEHALENLDTSQLIAIIMGLEDREEYVMDSVLNAAESFSAESKFIRPYYRKGKIDFRRDNKGRYRRKLSVPLKKNAEGDSQNIFRIADRYEMQARWARNVVDRAITKGCFSDELVKTLQDEADELGMSVGSK